jgi:hypothetical protein
MPGSAEYSDHSDHGEELSDLYTPGCDLSEARMTTQQAERSRFQRE